MLALVIGATGATGTDLMELLMKDVSFERIDLFAWRSLDIQPDKLKIHVIDFDQPHQWSHLVKVDVLFSCLGTTIKSAGSKENQWKVEYGYQYEFAKAARENGVDRYVLVSADFASPRARSFYSRMKGELEEAVKDLHFAHSTIIKPPILMRKNSERKLEVIALKAIQFLNKAGIFRSQKPLETEKLAQAMIISAKVDQVDTKPLKGNRVQERASSTNE